MIFSWAKHPDFRQFVRFVFVGVLNTIVGYGSYLLFLYLGLHYLFAVVFSHSIGVTHSYFWNKYWTFRNKTKSHKQKLKFVTVYCVTFALNAILLTFFVEFVRMSPQIGGFFALLIVTIASFCGHKFWSFRL